MGAARPYIFTGFDAQPGDTLDELMRYLPNAIHRFDDGPQHRDTLQGWLKQVRDLGLYYIVQGTACERFGLDMAELDADPLCLSVAQDDEPNMNRYDSQKNRVPEAELAKVMYTPTLAPPPHASMMGWTRAEVLRDRYARWKAKLPNRPISLNFAGPSLTSTWDAGNELAQHRVYYKACNEISYDEYVRNTGGEGWHLFFPAMCAEKVVKSGATLAGGYVEVADAALDGVEPGGRLRGPTPAEQSTQAWSQVARGVRQLWWWTQRTGIPAKFLYMNAPAENLARVVYDTAVMRRCDEIIGRGTVTIVTTPQPNYNAAKPPVVWPASEVVTWELDGKVLRVELDYTGRTLPVITEPEAPRPPEPAYASKEEVARLQAQVTELTNRQWKVVPA
jgi:hypothetical protein